MAVILQIVGAVCLIVAAGTVSLVFGLFVLGIALLVFGTLEELR